MKRLVIALFGSVDAAIDLGARTFWTFVQAFLGVLTAAALLTLDVTLLQTAAASGLSAVFAVVTGFARQQLGTRPPRRTVRRGEPVADRDPDTLDR